MSFFLTSKGSGAGGNLGGLAGADKICQDLAQAAGHGALTWRAYLSTQGQNAVNARDRIRCRTVVQRARRADRGERGRATWRSADRRRHSALWTSAATGIPGSGFQRRTGTTSSPAPRPRGSRAYPAGADMTCNNWTSSDEGEDEREARVGHHDYAAWNSTHDSRGCSQPGLVSLGGDGLFYCFALPAAR
jgi:hypothetical protein